MDVFCIVWGNSENLQVQFFVGVEYNPSLMNRFFCNIRKMERFPAIRDFFKVIVSLFSHVCVVFAKTSVQNLDLDA